MNIIVAPGVEIVLVQRDEVNQVIANRYLAGGNEVPWQHCRCEAPETVRLHFQPLEGVGRAEVLIGKVGHNPAAVKLPHNILNTTKLVRRPLSDILVSLYIERRARVVLEPS
jgi:hypothetical protein